MILCEIKDFAEILRISILLLPAKNFLRKFLRFDFFRDLSSLACYGEAIKKSSKIVNSRRNRRFFPENRRFSGAIFANRMPRRFSDPSPVGCRGRWSKTRRSGTIIVFHDAAYRFCEIEDFAAKSPAAILGLTMFNLGSSAA